MVRSWIAITVLALLGGVLLVGCGEAQPSGGDAKKQIDVTAKPTLPPPTASAGGGPTTPSQGSSATAQ